MHSGKRSCCGQVIAPYDAEDARGLLKAAIRDPDPVVFLENEILYGATFPIDEKVLDKDFVLPIGKCKVGILLGVPALLILPLAYMPAYVPQLIRHMSSGCASGR